MTAAHILLIEDDKRSAHSLERLLCAHGYSVMVCHDGTQGFQRAREGNFDLVITDFQLPGEDGLDPRQTMREKPSAFRTQRTNQPRERREWLGAAPAAPEK